MCGWRCQVGQQKGHLVDGDWRLVGLVVFLVGHPRVSDTNQSLLAARMTRAEQQLLRAYLDTKKREIRAAEQTHDVSNAAQLLCDLARPLTHPQEFHSSWKQMYLIQFYGDISKFVVTYVGLHMLPGFNQDQRTASFDVFFDPTHVPAMYAVNSLTSQINSTQTSRVPTPSAQADEAAQTLALVVQLLQRVLEQHGFAHITTELIRAHGDSASRNHALASSQPTVSSLCSVADLVYNRLQRNTPTFFSPRGFFTRLTRELLDTMTQGHRGHVQDEFSARAIVFRLFAEKLARIGRTDDLVRSWTSRSDLYDPCCEDFHRQLLSSLPPAAFEPFLLHFSILARPVSASSGSASASASQYRLLSLLPLELTANPQFIHAVSHKLILAKAINDPRVTRLLVDALSHGDTPESMPLVKVFDVIVTRWSGPEFALSTDYRLNASISLCIRYAMRKIPIDTFAHRDWTAKICRGVQAHMGHSVDRVRLLGMRMGESVSKIMSPEQPLNFEIDEIDELDEIMAVQFDFTTRTGDEVDERQSTPSSEPAPASAASTVMKQRTSRRVKGIKTVDPDAVVDSDEDEDDAAAGDEEDSDDGSDAASDVSLDAYDLHDDEQDLATLRPLYIKDILTGLHAEDDREKTEVALAECESLLRRQPKDLHFTAKDVVTALLRLEDKYNTPNFVLLRGKALAAACALSPATAVPYLQAQALEREQLLQSRLDVLQALTAAAQELSDTGIFRPDLPKSLLQEDIETRTTKGLKTRRFGYRRDPLAPAKKNAFGDHALTFFTPLLFGYAEYARKMEGSKRVPEIEDVFLAHLLHALASFVECAGHAAPAIPMAKCLMEFAWHHRSSSTAAVRRQVLYSFSRVLLVMPPFMLRQELGQNVIEMLAWLQETHRQDPDEGCRDASRLLLSSGAVPMLSMP